MMKNKYQVIGLMSGTSVDGLDLAYCSFDKVDDGWKFDLKASKSVEYNDKLRGQLKTATELPGLELLLLNSEYGEWLGKEVKTFVTENNIEADFVSSHGHTVFHQPEKRLTYQLGDGQELANACQSKVISNFRVKDVKCGGQGAPLVPIGDHYLFSEYDFCLNLGGISNISFQQDDKRLAYDIGIANMALNHLTHELGKTYDKDGAIGRSANLSQSLFSQLNHLAYYQLPFPKSTGFEWFEKEIRPLLDGSNETVENKVCTVTHHIAYTVAYEVNKLAKSNSRLLITGGGAKNSFLMDTLRHYLDDKTEMVIPDHSIIEFKEAIVFALMGVLRERGEVNCLKSVTGAAMDSCGGEIYWPGSYR